MGHWEGRVLELAAVVAGELLEFIEGEVAFFFCQFVALVKRSAHEMMYWLQWRAPGPRASASSSSICATCARLRVYSLRPPWLCKVRPG